MNRLVQLLLNMTCPAQDAARLITSEITQQGLQLIV